MADSEYFAGCKKNHNESQKNKTEQNKIGEYTQKIYGYEYDKKHSKKEYTVLLTGNSQSGKSTLIDCIANFFMGRESIQINERLYVTRDNTEKEDTTDKDAFCFYTFCTKDTVFNVIDSPSITNDSGYVDKKHGTYFQNFITEMKNEDITINAVGLVIQNHHVSLPDAEENMLMFVKGLVGDDISHIIPFITFADIGEPPVLNALRTVGLDPQNHLVFNNACLNDTTKEIGKLAEYYWNMSFDSVKKGIDIIMKLDPIILRCQLPKDLPSADLPQQSASSSVTSGGGPTSLDSTSEESPASVRPKSSGATEFSSNSTESKMKLTDNCGERNGLVLRKFQFNKEYEDLGNFIRRLSVGAKNDKPTKTLLLVGSCGAGKTTVINSLVNTIYGIRFEDKIRLTNAEEYQTYPNYSQTKWITIYEFNHIPGMSIDYNLTVIDTPGLNDIQGFHYDQLMVERLGKMLSTPEFGVNELHCIGLVAKSYATTLTPAQIYVYESCMRMFGNNVKDNIHIMATFADTSEPTSITNDLEAVGIEYKAIHQFNNSSIYLDNNSEDQISGKRNTLNWDAINKSCKEFLATIHTTPRHSLTLTIKTIQCRLALHKLHGTLSKTEPSFTSQLVNALFHKDQKIVASSKRASYCQKCHVTCHEPCATDGLFYTINCNTCKELSKFRNTCKACGCCYMDHESKSETFKISPMDISIINIKTLITSLKEILSNVAELGRVALRPTGYSSAVFSSSGIEQQRPYLEVMKREEENMQIFLEYDTKIEQLIRRLEKENKRKWWPQFTY